MAPPVLAALLGSLALAAQEAHGEARRGPDLRVVPDGPGGGPPLALVAVENDLGARLQGALVQATVPLPSGSLVEEGTPLVALRLQDGSPWSEASPVQVEALSSYPRERAADGAVRRGVHAALCRWRTDLEPGLQRFALFRTEEAPPAFRADEDLERRLASLVVECVGPRGEVYRCRPLSKARAEGGFLVRRLEGTAVMRAAPETEGALPHALAVKVWADLAAGEDVFRLEIAVMNGFSGQRRRGGWCAGDGFEPQAATSALFVREVALLLEQGGDLALRFEEPREGRAPADPSADDGRFPLLAAEGGAVLPLSSGAFVVRGVHVGPKARAQELELRCALPRVGLAEPAVDERGRELASWRTVGMIAGIPCSASDLQGAAREAFARRVSKELGHRLANPPRDGGKDERGWVGLGTLWLERDTLNGSTTGGYGIGTVWPEIHYAVRAQSADGARLIAARWRDLSDRADCAWFDALEDDERFGEPWLSTWGLERGKKGPALAPLKGMPLNFDVAPAPYDHASFWDLGRKRFESLPAYAEHVEAAQAALPPAAWAWRMKQPHDWQHAARYWPAIAAAYLLGSPSARFFARSLALSAVQARCPVAIGPASEEHAFGRPMTPFTLLAARNRLEREGGGRGGSGAGRALGWILWSVAAGAFLTEDAAELDLLEEQLRAEVDVLRRATIEEWGVPEVFPPGGRIDFALAGSAERVHAWHLQAWEMTVTAYGVLAARHWLGHSTRGRDLEAARRATEILHDIGRFNVHLAWNDAAGRPFTYVALAGPQGGRPARFPPPGEPILVVRGGEERRLVAMEGADAYYIQDLAALLAVEAEDETAAARLRGLAADYGASMGQLRLWFAEQGLLE